MVDDVQEIRIAPLGIAGLFGLPAEPRGVVVFAHGSGSSRHSPRNNRVAAALRDAGFGTLLIDLLSPEEEMDRNNVFDVSLLAERLTLATMWLHTLDEVEELPIGYFGASTGAAAAWIAASSGDLDVRAVVSRGGRPDLAGDALDLVTAPTLLIVGGLDGPVIDMNRSALARLRGTKQLVIVEGAGHLFEEPGTLDQVVEHATRWFDRHLAGGAEERS